MIKRPRLGFYHVGRRACAADIQLIDGPFAEHMREHGYSHNALGQYRYHLVRVAGWLAAHRRRLTSLVRAEVPRLVQRIVPKSSQPTYVGVLNRWLKFRQRHTPEASEPWAFWLGDYGVFLKNHRGFARLTAEGYVAFARSYLSWQFGGAEARWNEVSPQDIWRYAERCASGHSSGYTKGQLCALRRFLAFVQLRGACSQQLVQAIPKVANFRQHYSRRGFTDTQCRQLLRAFNRESPQGCCEHAAATCMIELGLRNCEVVYLRLQDIDWQQRIIRVPVMKTGVARIVPMPASVRVTLRHYINHARGDSRSDRVFLRHAKLAGKPVSTHCVRAAVQRAYRRCGFPLTYGGTHILRRTFATRLRAHGAAMREIGDLLGHQDHATTSLYTDVATADMRVVVQPWPIKP